MTPATKMEAERLASLLRSDAAMRANRKASFHLRVSARTILGRLRQQGARVLYRDVPDGIVTLMPGGVRFPFHVGQSDDVLFHATIFDATGAEIATVYPNRDRFSGAAAHNIAHAICLALNTITGHDTAPQQDPA